MKNIKIIKKNILFKQNTKKNKKYINFLKTKIHSHIDRKTAKLMIDFALNQKISENIFDNIKNDIFKNKKPVKNPEIHIVVGQAGAGKSNLTKIILEKYSNIVLLNTDHYKKYNPLKNLIMDNHPLMFGYLTALDCFLHRDKLYEKAVSENYNILIEVSPSTKEKLFNIDLEELKDKGYKVVFHILATSIQNSLLSIFERYERELSSENKTAKLTDLSRAVDSYIAVENILQNIIKLDFVTVKLYSRNHNQIQRTTSKNYAIKKFEELREQDKKETLKNLDKRIKKLTKQILKTNNPSYLEMFENAVKIIKEKQP